MADRDHQRSQILVDTGLQVGMSAKLVAWLYLYVAGFSLLVNAPAIWTIAAGSDADAGYLEAMDRLQWFARSTMLPLALTFVCVAIHCVVFTHRIAGPIFRVKAVLAGLSARKLPDRPVTLRDRDYFKDVATELNRVIDAQREDAARQRRMNGEIAAGIRDLRAAIAEERLAKPELEALARSALDKAERLDRHLAAVEPDAAVRDGAGATYVTAQPAEVADR